MPGTFTYTAATNTVVVTGGTALAPATFADFVAQDRSGTGTSLKAAAVAAAGMTLTYPVRPVEQKALRLTFTTAAAGGAAVSGDEKIDIYGTTGAWTTFSASEAAGQTVLSVTDASIFAVGDIVRLIDISAPATTETATISAVSIVVGANTITVGAITNAYIAGDIVGISQTETISTAAAHAAYVTSFPFGQVAYFDCTGYDGTNTVAVTQPIWGVIWNKGNSQYQIDATFNIGNASTATYFTTLSESIVFNSTKIFLVRSSATFQSGSVDSDGFGINGSFIQMSGISGTIYLTDESGSSIYLYSTILQVKGTTGGFTAQFRGTNIDFRQTIIRASGATGFEENFTIRAYAAGTWILDSVVFEMCRYIYWYIQPQTANDIRFHSVIRGPAINAGTVGTITITNSDLTGAALIYLGTLSPPVSICFVDCTGVSDCVKQFEAASDWGKEQYTIAIHVTDKNGVDLSGATVTWLDSQSNTGNTTTDVNGDLTAPFTLTAKQWVGTAETLTDYNTFTFTISKTGYETLVLQGITIDSAIDWHLELQDELTNADICTAIWTYANRTLTE